VPPRGSELYSQASSRLNLRGYDPRLAEESSARQERLDAERLRQLAEQGQIAAEGNARMGQVLSDGVRYIGSQVQQRKADKREQEAHQERMALAEENLAQQRAERAYWDESVDAAGNAVPPAPAPMAEENATMGPPGSSAMPKNSMSRKAFMRQIEMEKAREELRQMRDGKPTGLTPFQKEQLRLDEERLKLEREKAGKATEKKPELITYQDENGNTVQEFVTPEAGRKFSGKPVAPTGTQAAEEKSKKEVKYRYDNLKSNASKLRALVKQHGTVETTGSAGGEMDRLIYEMAIDYAKLVDPDSVAREGEVSAAQKYMLPIRNEMLGIKGMGINNDTAEQAISNYESALDDRLRSRGVEPTPTAVAQEQESGTAFASTPADGEKVINGKRYRKVQGGWQEVK
jgi:hypothetical protein